VPVLRFPTVPIYEYRCPNGHTFELFQRMSDPQPEACESCGASPVERVLYPVAVHYKGSGFYSTDYGRGNRKPTKDGGSDSSGSSGESSSSGGDSSSSSGDSKPAEKKAAAAD
jgi:putative FmdB family regulatory protein